METSLPLWTSSSSLSQQQALSTPRTEIAWDWYQKTISPPLCFSLAVDPEALWLVGARASAPHCDFSRKAGEFVEGLWEHELIEVFLSSPSSSRYLEVNLSPTGAWWCCTFHSYRKRDSAAPLKGVRSGATSLTPKSASWESWIRIPLASIEEHLRPAAKPKANVSGVVLSEKTPLYLSYAKLSEGEPDFHLTTSFLPVGPGPL